MNKIWKITSLILIVTFIVPMLGISSPLVSAQPNLNLNVRSAILVDAITGKILYGKNIDQPLPPASMTKMMTEYIVLEYIASGKVKWDDIVTASEYANWMGKYGGSRVFLGLGEKRTIKELVDAMAIYSANDATVALAEHLAGSESNFVEIMNRKAKELGMNQTHFLTSTGYPIEELGEYAPYNAIGEHVMSARDLAILAWHLINDYPNTLELNSQSKLYFRKGERGEMELPNFNWMLPGLIYEYQGVDGIKTGYTSEAGYGFTATAERNGVRLISVVTGTDSKKARFMETKKLLDYGFANYDLLNLVKAKDPIPGYEKVAIEEGKTTEVAVVPKNNLTVLVKKGEENLYKPIIEPNDTIKAPIKSEDVLGYVSYEYNGEEQYSYLNDYIKSNGKVLLIANEDVEKAGFIRLFFRKIYTMFNEIFTNIIDGILG
ncbi:D-alanyl-D-alanine carboxypeptidase family protein [Vulcanibacillus modesticaldus]|uniref:D-alanyl-D-alanine carboxypeptidase family protein n=1 Tax=Vulcanibacillus modesticaldus TaxID=337097 RepID=UPI000B0C8C3D|nr:D-alanyl-D-alanine carboxypeptidase family protein [Vulcanibacillus modesticaldus]